MFFGVGDIHGRWQTGLGLLWGRRDITEGGEGESLTPKMVDLQLDILPALIKNQSDCPKISPHLNILFIWHIFYSIYCSLYIWQVYMQVYILYSEWVLDDLQFMSNLNSWLYVLQVCQSVARIERTCSYLRVFPRWLPSGETYLWRVWSTVHVRPVTTEKDVISTNVSVLGM